MIPMMMPESFSIAILLPCWAIRPNRPALDFKEVPIFEKTSVYGNNDSQHHGRMYATPEMVQGTSVPAQSRWETQRQGMKTYIAVNQALISRIVVDVYRDAAKGGNFVGEVIEERIVLPVEVR